MTHQGKIFSVKLLSNVNVNRSTQNYQPSHTLSFLCLSPDTAKIPASLSQWLSLRGGVLSVLAHEENSFPSNMVLQLRLPKALHQIYCWPRHLSIKLAYTPCSISTIVSPHVSDQGLHRLLTLSVRCDVQYHSNDAFSLCSEEA